jgi:hypothetical protein
MPYAPTGIEIDIQTDRHIDRQIDRWMDGLKRKPIA